MAAEKESQIVFQKEKSTAIFPSCPKAVSPIFPHPQAAAFPPTHSFCALQQWKAINGLVLASHLPFRYTD